MKFNRIQQRPAVRAVHRVLVTTIVLLSMQLSTAVTDAAAPDSGSKL